MIRQPSLPKKMLFGSATTIVAFGLLELALWAFRIEPAWTTEDPYAGFSRHLPHFVVERADDGTDWVSVSATKSRVLNPQRFPVAKPPGGYRIVCLGGSTTYGRPFYDLTSYPGWLRAFLPAAQSDRPWEVINAGGISYASYRMVGLMEELVEWSPELFVVYAGENEFLERRTYSGFFGQPALLTAAASLASRTRTMTVVRGAMEAAGLRQARGDHRAPVLGEETKAIPINAIGPEAYRRDEAFAQQVVGHYRASLRRMARLARARGADLLFVIPASNLSDFAPFKSEHRAGLDEAGLARWNEHDRRARGFVATGNYTEALREIEEAEAIDNRFAALWFLKGQVLRGLGRFEAAREAFRRARDEDICPLRPIDAIRRALRETAASQGVALVDFEALLEAHAENGLLGEQWFHDHVHPSLEANRLLALAILDRLRQTGVLNPGPEWGETTRRRVEQEVIARIDRPVHAEQLRILASLYAWLGQPDRARYQASLALELSGPTTEALVDLARRLRVQGAPALAVEYAEQAVAADAGSGKAWCELGLGSLACGRENEAVRQLEAAVEFDPGIAEAHTRLGIVLAGRGELVRAEEHFATVVRLEPRSDVAHVNLGLALARQKRFDEAIAHYQRALDLAPRSWAAHYNCGLALEQLGRTAEARARFQEVLRLEPNHQPSRDRLQALAATGP